MEASLLQQLRTVQYLGTATSHFQSEPWQDAPPRSDWEYELQSNLRGQKSGITVPQSIETLPRLLPNQELYVQRSLELGMNMYRFSFDPARVQPDDRTFDTRMMDAYVRFLGRLIMTGQEPMVTLHHFTMPLSFTEIPLSGGRSWTGAWEHPKIVDYFATYIRNVVGFLGSRDLVRRALRESMPAYQIDKVLAHGLVQYFMPFNEPLVTFGNSYGSGLFPPYKKGRIDLGMQAVRKMAQVYRVMAEELRELGRRFGPERETRVGIGYNWQYVDGFGSGAFHALANEWPTRYLEKAARYSDWVGLHYYCRTFSLPGAPDQERKEYSEHTLFGDIYPKGILPLLRQMRQSYPAKELFVSEIGFSDSTDKRRPWWLLETVRYILEAVREGIPVKGILHWSLADMFEWDQGMSQHFGLFAEAELSQPLVPSEDGVRSWEIWQALAECKVAASSGPLGRLENLEKRALEQHQRHVLYKKPK